MEFPEAEEEVAVSWDEMCGERKTRGTMKTSPVPRTREPRFRELTASTEKRRGGPFLRTPIPEFLAMAHPTRRTGIISGDTVIST